jgi:hypothetical protein
VNSCLDGHKMAASLASLPNLSSVMTPQLGGSVSSCHVCGKLLLHMTVPARLQHVNKCVDAQKALATTAKLQPFSRSGSGQGNPVSNCTLHDRLFCVVVRSMYLAIFPSS